MIDTQAMDSALDQLHCSILTADFARLPRILEELERLASLPTGPADKAVMARLQIKVHRNDQCLQASIRGLRAAQRRVAEVNGIGMQLSTYTNLGTRSDLAMGPGTMAKRL